MLLAFTVNAISTCRFPVNVTTSPAPPAAQGINTGMLTGKLVLVITAASIGAQTKSTTINKSLSLWWRILFLPQSCACDWAFNDRQGNRSLPSPVLLATRLQSGADDYSQRDQRY